MPAEIAIETVAVREIFERQRAAFRAGAPAYKERVRSLDLLKNALVAKQPELVAAVDADFCGRARQETLALELAPLIAAIRHTKRHLARWMKPRPVSAELNFFPARAKIVYQPLGVVGIIGAWNYPIFLTLGPLVDAIAAGNHAMLKPSELAPRTAELLKEIITANFVPERVAVIPGDCRVAEQFTQLPFDHLLFTGSTRVGKMVMRAASENLTPVTLELGGKCPAIIHPEFPLRLAVERILTGKLYNAGQTCLAPDYVFVHESKQEEFVRIAIEVAKELYPNWAGNQDYTKIVNAAHYDRLIGIVRDAKERGARAVALGFPAEGCSRENRVFAPILLQGVNEEMLAMREEIFGPILSLLSFKDIADALQYVNEQPQPLALYYFDHDGTRVDQVLQRTRSGGVTVNDVIYHVAQNNLPFGGTGSSGMGRYHGFAGFETFSLKKSVLVQGRFSSAQLLRPPYGAWSERAIRFLLRK